MFKTLLLTLLLACSTLTAAESFDFKTVDGKRIAVQNYDGNFVFADPKYKKGNLVFFFFGTKCPYCEIDIPKVEKLYKSGDVEVIGVEAQTRVDGAALHRFTKSKGITFPVVDKASGNRLVRYLDSRRMWAGGVPSYIWVDKFGNLEALDFKELSKIAQ